MKTLGERLMDRLRQEIGDTPEGLGILATVQIPISLTPEPKLRELLTQLRDTFDEVLG
jgi:hypothetical protein